MCCFQLNRMLPVWFTFPKKCAVITDLIECSQSISAESFRSYTFLVSMPPPTPRLISITQDFFFPPPRLHSVSNNLASREAAVQTTGTASRQGLILIYGGSLRCPSWNRLQPPDPNPRHGFECSGSGCWLRNSRLHITRHLELQEIRALQQDAGLWWMWRAVTQTAAKEHPPTTTTFTHTHTPKADVPPPGHCHTRLGEEKKKTIANAGSVGNNQWLEYCSLCFFSAIFTFFFGVCCYSVIFAKLRNFPCENTNHNQTFLVENLKTNNWCRRCFPPQTPNVLLSLMAVKWKRFSAFWIMNPPHLPPPAPHTPPPPQKKKIFSSRLCCLTK